MSKFSAQDLTNTAWVLARVNQSDARLFMVLATEVEQRHSELKAQNLANTAWAFATVARSDEKLFTTLATQAERR